jgi:orotate phosphoribosyltransferase
MPEAQSAVRLKETALRNIDRHLRELCALVQSRSIVKKALEEPDFVLTSGAHSRFYCDTKRVTLSPEGARMTGEILFSLIDGEAQAVGGLTLGAAFIATAVALVSSQHDHPIYAFTVRDEPKRHGTKEMVAQSYHPDDRELLCPGRRVAVVDDVVTKGGSILKAVEEVEKRHCEIAAVIALIDRGGRGRRGASSTRTPILLAIQCRLQWEPDDQ